MYKISSDTWHTSKESLCHLQLENTMTVYENGIFKTVNYIFKTDKTWVKNMKKKLLMQTASKDGRVKGENEIISSEHH